MCCSIMQQNYEGSGKAWGLELMFNFNIYAYRVTYTISFDIILHKTHFCKVVCSTNWIHSKFYE